MLKKNNMEKKNMAILSAIILLLALGAGAYLYFSYNGRPQDGNDKKLGNGALSSNENPFGSHGNIEIVGADYKTLADMGIGWARTAGSRGLHFDNGNYDFSGFEEALNKSVQNGLEVVVTVKVGGSREGMECTDKYPQDIGAYDDFLRDAVNRYKNRVKYYQIENEPEGENFWCDTPENYAKLLRDAYLTIKEACSECKVVIGGATSGHFHTGDDSFYDAALKTLKTYPECQQNGCHDIFDLHTASCDVCLNSKTKISCDAKDCSFSFIKNTYDTAVKLQNKYGFVKPIWSTEFGHLGGELKNTEVSLIKSYVYAFDLGYEKIFWRVAEECCQIWDKNKPTNTYYAYKTLIKKIGGYSEMIKIADGQYKFTFQNKNPVYVLWCNSLTSGCSLPSEISGNVKLTNYAGNEKTTNSNDTILTEKPIFIEEIK